MKDPIGIILALLFTGMGIVGIFFPQLAYRVATTEQAGRDRKRVRMFGFIFLPLGLILLLFHFGG